MTEHQVPPSFGMVGSLLKWLGLSGLMAGFGGSAYAVATYIQTQTGWGLSSFERCCMIPDLNKAALALLLGCMFFVLAGAGLVLISRPLIRPRKSGPLRWPRWVAHGLFVYSACCFALAIIIVREFAPADTAPGVLAGMVGYCVMVGVGLLVACWGLKRFADIG